MVVGVAGAVEQGEVMEMSQKFLQEIKHGTSLVVRCLKSAFRCRGARVQSLVRELRSHMPDGTASKKCSRTKTCYVPQGSGVQWTQTLVHPVSPPPHFHILSYLTDPTSCSHTSHLGHCPVPEEAREARNGNLTMPQRTGDLGQTLLPPRASGSLSAR